MKLNKDLLDKIFVTSDTHYGHQNICRGVSQWDLTRKDVEGNILGVRDFDTLEEMNRAVVDNINAIVPTDGILFHLGDWSFGGKQNIEIFRNQIKCETIHLVTGNHDEHICKGDFDYLFTTRQTEIKLVVGKSSFHFHHHPFESWDGLGRGWFHPHGHMHRIGGARFGNGRKMDVGMDGNDLKPYKLTDVIEMLTDRVYVGTDDHHV